jgi:hypothetical protein
MGTKRVFKDFRSRPSVQIGWFKNRRNLLQGIKIVDKTEYLSPEQFLCRLGTKY